MISYIKGTLEEKNTDSVVVDVNGVGFLIYVSGRTLDELPGCCNIVKMHTYMNVREDAMTLYGFMTKDELLLFKLLINVNGIGPKGGLAVLSVLSTEELRFAILSGDAKAIAKAPGIGAKTAQKVILDLKDKISIEETLLGEESCNIKECTENNQVRNETIMALNSLGYSSSESFKVVSKIEITDGMTVEDVLKRALKEMAFL